MGTPAPALDVALSEMYRLFAAANVRFHHGRLPTPAITIQSSGRSRRTLGWCTGPVWTDNQGAAAYEINISAEGLSRGALEVAETLLHEVAHLANLVAGVADVSSHQYHNQRFKLAAERTGLLVEQLPGRGWAKTTLAPATKQWLETLQLKESAFGHARAQAPEVATGDGLTGKLRRWSCGCTNVRAAGWLSATCNRCGRRFVLGAKASRTKQ